MQTMRDEVLRPMRRRPRTQTYVEIFMQHEGRAAERAGNLSQALNLLGPPPKKNPEIEQGPKSGRVLSINGPFSGIFNALEYCLPVLVVLWLFILP